MILKTMKFFVLASQYSEEIEMEGRDVFAVVREIWLSLDFVRLRPIEMFSVWVKVKLGACKHLYSDAESLEQRNISHTKLPHNAYEWLVEDMNLPIIEWSNIAIKGLGPSPDEFDPEKCYFKRKSKLAMATKNKWG